MNAVPRHELAAGEPLEDYRILDFGAARNALQQRSRVLTELISEEYAPVEQYGREDHGLQGAWGDIYALGATLHHAMTGKVSMPAPIRTVDETPEDASSAVDDFRDSGVLVPRANLCMNGSG